MTIRAFAFLCSLATGAIAVAQPAIAEDPYFKDKTITLLVGYDSGQTDLTARVLATHLEKAVPGNPTVIVKNMPGAGTMKAQNFIYEIAKPDGLTIGFNPFLVMAQLTGAEGLRFKYQEMTFIAGVLTAPFMAVVRADTVPGGYQAPADIVKATGLKYTGRHPMNIIDITATTALDALGVDYVYVSGHSGDAKIAKSLEQDETNITGSTYSAWQNFMTRMAEDGTLVKLFYNRRKGLDGNLVDDPNYSDWPTFSDVYREVKGEAPSGDLWDAYAFANDMLSTATWIVAGPPGLDEAVAADLREGVRAVVADPAFQEEASKVVGNPLSYVGPEQAEGALNQLRTIDPAIATFWKERADKLVQ
jgi:tripartite-type tricarboxylate transporter receptor subunit TctC